MKKTTPDLKIGIINLLKEPLFNKGRYNLMSPLHFSTSEVERASESGTGRTLNLAQFKAVLGEGL